jgi:DNA-binding transcriptional LysR family regulator
VITDITVVNDIDLNLLRVLHAVLEERSVTRAAHRLHLTQPAVSNALARLRDRLGDRLVVRAGRNLEPTPRAAAMQPRLAALLGEVAQLVDPGFDARTTTRTFTLADSEELSELPRLAGAFARRFPAAMLRLVTVDDLAAALISGTADVALGPAGLTGAGLMRRKLYSDEVVRVVRKGHPHARSPELLARLPEITVHSERSRPAVAGSGARVAMTMPDYMSAALAVSQTDHVTTLPRRFAHAITRLLPLRLVGTVRAAIPIALYWHDRTHADPGSTLFRTLVIDAVTHA